MRLRCVRGCVFGVTRPILSLAREGWAGSLKKESRRRVAYLKRKERDVELLCAFSSCAVSRKYVQERKETGEGRGRLLGRVRCEGRGKARNRRLANVESNQGGGEGGGRI